MKKIKLKSPKRKVISHRYQKNSNTSLSKLLHIASYKKRINDLVYNNRRLARELQSAKCEIAAQNTLLEDNAKNRSQIMFATLKLNDMANSITKLVTDLDEVRNYLHNSLSSNEFKFPAKGFLHPKKVVPTVDCIEEVSVLSSSNTSFKENTSPKPGVSSLNSPNHSAGKRKRSNEMQLTNSQSDDPEGCEVSFSLPPILFVDDNGNAQGKNVKKSSKTKSSEQCKEDHGSLTPELDVDLSCFRRRKSNSRRQTQFRLSNPRKTKSRGKSSAEDSQPLLLPERNYEHCLLSMAASSSTCQTRVSNSRKTKSKGETPPEVTSPVMESEPIGHVLLSSVASRNSCQTLLKVSDTKLSKSRGRISHEVVSPPLQCEEISAQASYSRSHSLSNVSNSRKTKSKGKSSPETDSFLLQSEQMSFETSKGRKKTSVKITNSRKTKSRGKSAETTSPMMKAVQMSIKNAVKQQEISDSSQNSEQRKNVNYSSNMHCIAEKLPNHFSNLLTSDIPLDCVTFKKLPDVPPDIGPLAAVPNNTLLLCEDMELTDVIAVNPIIHEYNTVNKGCNYEIKSNVPDNSNCSKENGNSVEEPSKLDEVLEPFVKNNSGLTTIVKDNIQESEIVEQDRISEKTEGNTLSVDDSLLISSPRRSRNKGTVQYCYFSSSSQSDSENEHDPTISKSRKKRSSSDEKRETVIFKPDTNLKTLTTPNNSSKTEGNLAVPETSVFSFNVSLSEKNDTNQNSDNNVPKKSKLSRNKKNIKNNDLPVKSLSQSCNVTKLKGFNYKFTKTKSPIGGRKLSKGKGNKQKMSNLSSNICESVLSEGSVSDGHASELLTNNLQEKSLIFQAKNMAKSVQNVHKGLLNDLSPSKVTPRKHDITFESVQFERKRVSFASTDLVCNFKKMSLSKAIAVNTKVRRISKSLAELGDLCEESFKKLNDSNDSVFNLDDETEIYAVNLKSHAYYPDSQENNQQSSPSKSAITSTVEHDKEILCNENLTNMDSETEEVSKVKVKPSQKKLLQTVSPLKSIPEFKDLSKKDAAKKSVSLNKAKDSGQPPCSDKINDTKDSLLDFSDIEELSKNILSNVLYPSPQAIDQQPPLKISIPSVVESELLGTHIENLTNENEKILEAAVPQKKTLPKISLAKKKSAFENLPVKTSRKSIKLYKDSKENHIQNHLETARSGKQIKQRDPLSHIQPPQDDLEVRCIDIGENELTSSAKSKKKVTKKATKSAPSILKNNLEIRCSLLGMDAPKTSTDIKEIDSRPKRRSKPVIYKEPSLNKKMRQA